MVSVSNSPPDEAAQEDFSVDERRGVIERIAASAQFRRSARLRDFLIYVGMQSLKEGCPEIHEQEIGAKVFGRPPSYDRSQDNIVRVNASELRKRIEIYFATEGAGEPLILEIPRGAYKPVFHRRTSAAEGPAQVAPETPSKTTEPLAAGQVEPTHLAPTRVPRYVAHLVWGAICVALTVVCGMLYLQDRSMRTSLYSWDGKPAVQDLWKDFLSSHRQADIVLPDDSLSIIGDIDHASVPLSQYLDRTYLAAIRGSAMSADRKLDLLQIANHNLVTFGAFRATQQITALTPVSPTLNLTLSRYYTADALKRNNVILIGGKKANPWTQLFEDRMNFTLDYDFSRNQAVVLNRHPQTGETPVYAVPNDPNGFVSYSVVAYLPNLSRTGNAIIIAGTDSDATGAAAEFLTSEEQLERFRNTLHVKKFPYFEALLKTSRLSGTSLSAELLAYRTYPGLK